jgi:putative phosphoserine phosphatase/1-acylglycerol-3-phosphate O-acyltransferase
MNPGVQAVIAAVGQGPAGSGVGAFFDLDGTIVQGYTAGTFVADRIRRGQVSPADLARTLVSVIDGAVLGGDLQAIGETGLAALAGQSEDELAELGERLFLQKIAGTIRPQARDLVRAHLRQGHTVAVASSATRMQIEPVARDLGIEHVLCTELEAEDGILTGRSSTGMLWGDRKATAVRSFARTCGIDLKQSYGYANGQEDIPFLASVGRPHAINPHPVLAVAARQHGWPVLTLREPISAGITSYLGTAAALAGMNVGLGVGVLTGLARRNRRVGTNIGLALACDLAMALAGVKLRVIGAHNLTTSRPAVFVFNHQSTLDALIVAGLVRTDFTGVAKKEARWDPRMMLIGALLDPAFVDRGNTSQARTSLDAVVGRIRAGTSVVIAPEGTRTATPVLQSFKKGAFHLAMQAGVPMIPIVIRNAGELMWRRSGIINPGTVDVAVLDPIPTGAWTVGNLSKHVSEVRQLFADTLENWSAATAGRDAR